MTETAPARVAPLLDVQNLVKRFPLRTGLLGTVTSRVHAVESVSFEIRPGETLAMVGESGCGKSTVARTIMQLERPDGGAVLFEGEDVHRGGPAVSRKFRQKVQMVFQDPMSSLNPRMTIEQAITDPMRIHLRLSRDERRERAKQLLDRVGLKPEHLDRYPHAFSGGQRQRICIARALALEPKLIVADEAVASLDVTIRAQVINLLMDLQTDLGISLLFISHDMAVVERIAHRVAVMYLGQIVEIGDRRSIFTDPQHSYTKKLLSSVPVADPRQRNPDRQLMVSEIPSALHPADYEPVILPLNPVSPTHFVRAEVA
ncbi:MAG: ABC transporter ATP-binding protein [Devosia sp.]